MRRAMGIALAAAVVAATACGGSPACIVVLGPWGDEMPDLDMMVGDTVKTTLAGHFVPTYCLEGSGPDIWGLQSSNPAAVGVSVSAEHVLRTVAIREADSVRVTVWLSYDDPQYFHEFFVSVAVPR